MKVELLDYMGTDLDVCNAARVSFSKESKGVWMGVKGYVPMPKDEKLIHYLVEHEHWSPFSHVIAKFRVTAPIIINHQLWKSHIGAATQDDICGWNGVSRRYVDSPPELYMPQEWRKKAEDKKQGSGGTFPPENALGFSEAFSEAYKACLWAYEAALASGLAPEQARMVLPQSMMTEWIWTGSLAFWARLYKLRMHETAQEECKPIASAIGEHMSKLFPISWKELTNAI